MYLAKFEHAYTYVIYFLSKIAKFIIPPPLMLFAKPEWGHACQELFILPQSAFFLNLFTPNRNRVAMSNHLLTISSQC